MSPVMVISAQTRWRYCGILRLCRGTFVDIRRPSPHLITITVNHRWARPDLTSGKKPNTNVQMLRQSIESLFAWNKSGKLEYICTFILTIRSGLSGLLFPFNVKLRSYIDHSLKTLWEGGCEWRRSRGWRSSTLFDKATCSTPHQKNIFQNFSFATPY